METERADVIYSDPPWGPGLLQYFHTLKHRGSRPPCDWPSFLAAFCAGCAEHRTAAAPVFVEMGLRWEEELVQAMAQVGLPCQRRWSVSYGPRSKPLPNRLLLFGPQDLPLDLGENSHGEPVTRTILSAVVRRGMRVLDPCTGKGRTARWTHRRGGRFLGLELNPQRLQVAADWLRRH